MYEPTPQDWARWKQETDAWRAGFPSGEHQHWTQENVERHWICTLFDLDRHPSPQPPLGVWHILYACPVPTCNVAHWDRSRCAGKLLQHGIVRQTESHHVYHFLRPGQDYEIVCPVPKGPNTPRAQADLFEAASVVYGQQRREIEARIAKAKREQALLRELNNKCRM